MQTRRESSIRPDGLALRTQSVNSGTLHDVKNAAQPRHGESAESTSVATSGCNVLFVMNSLNIGGTERKIVRITNQFAARGVTAAIVHLNGPDTLVATLDARVPRHCLNRQGRFSVTAARRLAAIIDELKPRVVVGANLYPSLYVFMARWFARHKPAIAALVNITDMGPTQRVHQRFYRALLSRFDSVVYGCRAQLNEWVDRKSSARQRASVVYNGVNLAEFTNTFEAAHVAGLRKEYGFSEQSFVIGSVGRLYVPKNQGVLIDAVAALRAQGVDARLILAGDGPDRENLRQHAAAAGVAEFVVMTGNLGDVRPVLACMDVFVLPSLYVETFSNAALEAMAMGRPVILSDIAGASEMIRNGVDGYVIAPQRLSAELPQLLSRFAAERALRITAGEKARKRVEESFSFDAMVDHYEDLIRRLECDGRRP